MSEKISFYDNSYSFEDRARIMREAQELRRETIRAMARGVWNFLFNRAPQTGRFHGAASPR